jgi:hypothetical protein
MNPSLSLSHDRPLCFREHHWVATHEILFCLDRYCERKNQHEPVPESRLCV